MANPKAKDAALRVVEHLFEMPFGAKTSIWDALTVIYGESKPAAENKTAFGDTVFEDRELMDIAYITGDLALERGILLDYSQWDGADVGLPYAISFKINKGKKR